MVDQPKTPEVIELVKRKASELVTMFTNYLKDKAVCEGRLGLEAETEKEARQREWMSPNNPALWNRIF